MRLTMGHFFLKKNLHLHLAFSFQDVTSKKGESPAA